MVILVGVSANSALLFDVGLVIQDLEAVPVVDVEVVALQLDQLLRSFKYKQADRALQVVLDLELGFQPQTTFLKRLLVVLVFYRLV